MKHSGRRAADSLALVDALCETDSLADSDALVDALCETNVLADSDALDACRSDALVEALCDADVLAVQTRSLRALCDARLADSDALVEALRYGRTAVSPHLSAAADVLADSLALLKRFVMQMCLLTHLHWLMHFVRHLY